jgi:hypothetical protein
MTPALRRVLVLCVAYRALTGLLLAAPLAAGVGAIVGEHPAGDALLWQPGGYWLVEAGRVHRAAIGGEVVKGGIPWLVMLLGWLMPLGALIAAVGSPEDGLRQQLRVAARRLGGLVLVFGVALVAQALAIGAPAFAASRLAEGLPLRAVLALAGAALVAVVAITHDVARVLWVQHGVRMRELGDRAIEALVAQPVTLLLAALWRAGAAWALALAMLALSTHVVGLGAVGLAIAAAAQLTAISGYVLLRASWLAWLTRRLRAGPPVDGVRT